MRVFVFMVMLIVATSVPFISSSFLPDAVFPGYENSVAVMTHNRKLMENYNPSKEKNKNDNDNMNLEDYHPVDPAPSSKAAIKTGPIEHGSPLIPYIPKPGSPPSNLKQTVSPSPA